MSQDVTRLAADLAAAGRVAERRARGALGDGADLVRDNARRMAASKGWSEESQNDIYARTGATNEEPQAFVFGTGAVAYQETGTPRHGPNPVLGPAMDATADVIDDMIADRLGDIL